MATRSLALVAVLVAVEAVGVAAWVLALVVELTCAWRPQGRTASFQKVCVAEFISRKLLAARPNRWALRLAVPPLRGEGNQGALELGA